MKRYEHPICKNELRTKDDLQQAFYQLTEPLKPHYSEGCAHLHLGNTGAGYAEDLAEMEGFSRILWGLASLSAGNGDVGTGAGADTCSNTDEDANADVDLWKIYIKGIINGTNPEHKEYWGKINDYDQRVVEMAAMGFSLAVVPEKIWDPLSDVEKSNFANWLQQINDHKVYDCNWLFFPVVVNLGLKSVGVGYDQQKVNESLERMEAFYLGDGWYSDGVNGHADYYVSFAIHYYSLMYAKFMGNDDPVRAACYKERAAIFAKDFVNWFSEDGSALPYGRSLTYKFAQCAFWAALAYAEVDVFSPGVIKGIVLRNLRWWFDKPIFDADGILTIGYAYPNLVMGENYNSPGSSYWAMKSFLPLCLEDSHPFWNCEEEPLPELAAVVIQEKPHLVICRDNENQNVKHSFMAFNTGHLTTNEHTHTSAKYEKFVYSNCFGFSVPRAEWGLGQGAFDSMLALSEQDNLYRVKRYCKESSMQKKHLFMRWNPWENVEVKTYLIFGNPWHYRVHIIDTKRSLTLAEGGFAVGIEPAKADGMQHETIQLDQGIGVRSEHGISGIINLLGDRNPELVIPNANTNLMHARTAIPTLIGNAGIGTHCLVSAVFASPSPADIDRCTIGEIHAQANEKEILIWNGRRKNVIFQIQM